MKQQSGCVSIHHNSWVCRWRESLPDGNGGTIRKLRFKVLGEVMAEHRRNKDRKTGKLRVPDDIQQQADEIANAVKTCKMSVLSTIEQFVTDYLKDKEPTLRPGTYAGYTQLWEKYLKPRVGSKVLRDFKRPDAYILWQEIARMYPVSRQTMNHIRFFMSGVFKAALNRGFMSGENPAEADLPNGLRGRGETEAYTIEEVKRILSLFIGQLKPQAVIALGCVRANCRRSTGRITNAPILARSFTFGARMFAGLFPRPKRNRARTMYTSARTSAGTSINTGNLSAIQHQGSSSDTFQKNR